jgi:hypothetical protein
MSDDDGMCACGAVADMFYIPAGVQKNFTS